MHPHEQFGHQLKPHLTAARRVLLTITESPDGDSVGSLVAMRHGLRHLGKECVCYSPDPIPPMFDYLHQHLPGAIVRDLPGPVSSFDLVIIFDTGDIKRTPLIEDFASRRLGQPTIVNIDHHPTVIEHRGRTIVDLNLVDTRAAATTEIVAAILETLGVPMTPALATSLLTGLLTDTGHFSNLGTTASAMDLAARLMAKGAAHMTITAATMHNKSLGTLQLWGRALSRLRHDARTGIVSTIVTLQDIDECGADGEATTGIANFLNGLSEGRVTLILQELPGQFVKGSLRTTSDVNVADIAKQFGGGGHPKAAGFKIRGRLVATRHGWRVDPPLAPLEAS